MIFSTTIVEDWEKYDRAEDMDMEVYCEENGKIWKIGHISRDGDKYSAKVYSLHLGTFTNKQRAVAAIIKFYNLLYLPIKRSIPWLKDHIMTQK